MCVKEGAGNIERKKKTKEKNMGDNKSEKTKERTQKKKEQEQREERLKRGGEVKHSSGSSLAHVGSAKPNQKKESGPDLSFRLSRSKLCLLRACLAKHTLMSILV